MEKQLVVQLCALTLTLLWGQGEAHGRLRDPPGRSTMWREGYPTPRDYNDNELSCGGFAYQVSQGYKCGICGDKYDSPSPRAHENGGTYGRGVIARTYTKGQTIQAKVEITANHKGWFEFRLCPLSDKTKPATLSCLDQNLLPLVNGTTRYMAGDTAMTHTIGLKLPAGLTCDQCVFQWRYHTGNSWGTDEDGTGLGHGPQEEFYGCADVKIV